MAEQMYDILDRVLYSQEEILTRVKEVAKELDRDYEGKRPIMVSILKGSILFYADLVKAMSINLEMDFMSISSYGNEMKSSGEVKMLKDLDRTIEGRHVILVEDIVDTGYTLNYLKKTLSARGPASIKICTLLNKPSRRIVDLKPDYSCFEVGNEFVVGYGLDYLQFYRNLPCIGVVKKEIYS